MSVATGRPGGAKKCTLLLSTDGLNFLQIADFAESDPRATTTGQPFITSRGTILVPVWNVDYYHVGATYCAIYRSADKGKTWSKVYEDPRGTYANHFFESEDGNHLLIGVGRGGGGREGIIRYTPASSYLLHSNDDGRSWSTILEYDKPSSLYQGVVLDDRSVIVTTREQKSLIRLSLPSGTWEEHSLGRPTRCIAYVPEMERFVVSADSSIYVSRDTVSWSLVRAPVGGPLRYPIFHDGLLHLACAKFPPSVVATNLASWYMVHDSSRISKRPITRTAIFKDAVYSGSEFEGYLLRFSSSSNRRKLGLLARMSLRLSKSLPT